MPGAMCGLDALPPQGGRAHQVVRKSHAWVSLAMEKQLPPSGSCCVPNNPRGFLYLSTANAAIGKFGRHVRLLPQKKKKKNSKSSVEEPVA